MRAWQKILLAALVLALLVLTVVTWGSIGSAVTVMCMVTLCSALAFQKYVTNRNTDDFDME